MRKIKKKPIQRNLSKKKLNKEQSNILKEYSTLAKKLKQFPTLSDLDSADVTRGRVRHHFGSLSKLKAQFKLDRPKEYSILEEIEKQSKIKIDLLKQYAELVVDYGRFLTQTELNEYSITANMVKHHFGNLSKFAEETEKAHPELFSTLVTEALFTPERLEETKEEIKNYDRFVITTVLAGCKVDKKFLASLKTYCDINDALLLLLPVADPASNRSRMGQHMMFDGILRDEHFVYNDVTLNSNFAISGIRLQAKQINPFTGLHRVGRTLGSMAYGSPKQSLEPIAGEEWPRFIMTPGALTKPDYSTELYISNRTAYLAHHDHVMGALVVEVVDDEKYFFRQFQADKEGKFVDLGYMYDGEVEEAEEYLPEGFVLGDIQYPKHDPIAIKCWEEVQKEIPAKKVFLHDVREGMPESHWDKKDNILMAIKAEEGVLDVKKDIIGCAEMINGIAEWEGLEEVVIVKSNHDEFVDRWLSGGTYPKEPNNFEIGHILALDAYYGKKEDQYYDVLKAACEKLNNMSDKVRWLRRNDRVEIGSVECGKHGDRGSRGKYTSPLTDLEKTYKNMVIGHRHAVQIMRGIWVVGTTGNRDPRFRKGPNDWTHTSCHVYPNGMRQLITCINGQWRA